MIELLGALLATTTQIFKLVNTKESRKYLDESLELQNEYDEEILKPLPAQSDERFITVKRKLLILNETAIRLGAGVTTAAGQN